MGVPDNGNLADTMATYYSLLSSLLRPCRVRWTEYNDWFTGLPLLSACLAAYEKSNSAAATSCNGGLDGLGDHDDTSGTVPKLSASPAWTSRSLSRRRRSWPI